MFAFISHLIKNRDGLGDEFAMNFKGQDRHKTCIGGCFTILTLVITYSILYKMIGDYFKTTDPDVRQNIEISSTYPNMDLYAQNLGYMFSLDDYSYSVDVDELEKYVTIVGRVLYVVSDPKKDNGKDYRESYIIFEPCKNKNDTLNQFFVKEAENYTRDFGLCMKLDNTSDYNIISKVSELPYKYIEINVYPCTLEDTTECVAEKSFESLSLILGQVTKNFDPSNKTNPVTSSSNLDTIYTFDLKNTLYTHQVFKKTEINDDAWDFYDAAVKTEFIDVDKTTTFIKSRPETQLSCKEEDLLTDEPICMPYFSFVLRSGGSKLKITREYKKILVVLSDFGGFIDILALIIASFFLCCRENTFDRFLKKSILKNNDKEIERFLKRQMRKIDLQEAASAVVEEKQEAINLFETMNDMEVLRKIIFKPHMQVLLPVVLLLEKSTELREKNEEEQNKEGSKPPMSLEEALNILRTEEESSPLTAAIREYFLNVLDRRSLKQLQQNETPNEIDSAIHMNKTGLRTLALNKGKTITSEPSKKTLKLDKGKASRLDEFS